MAKRNDKGFKRKKRKKYFKGRHWEYEILRSKIWEMAEGEEEGDKSRIKSASCQGRQALKITSYQFNSPDMSCSQYLHFAVEGRADLHDIHSSPAIYD